MSKVKFFKYILPLTLIPVAVGSIIISTTSCNKSPKKSNSRTPLEQIPYDSLDAIPNYNITSIPNASFCESSWDEDTGHNMNEYDMKMYLNVNKLNIGIGIIETSQFVEKIGTNKWVSYFDALNNYEVVNGTFVGFGNVNDDNELSIATIKLDSWISFDGNAGTDTYECSMKARNGTDYFEWIDQNPGVFQVAALFDHNIGDCLAIKMNDDYSLSVRVTQTFSYYFEFSSTFGFEATDTFDNVGDNGGKVGASILKQDFTDPSGFGDMKMSTHLSAPLTNPSTVILHKDDTDGTNSIYNFLDILGQKIDPINFWTTLNFTQDADDKVYNNSNSATSATYTLTPNPSDKTYTVTFPNTAGLGSNMHIWLTLKYRQTTNVVCRLKLLLNFA
ncbi:MAG: hypothetical protein Ta2E_06170 [Mycoplasmoidaceae bacterium]|nr:MAG: hypothetical protein Ta2E_06170 [Mycoplasmoidaceae bacterium]